MQIFQETAVAPTITKDVQTSPYQDFADGLEKAPEELIGLLEGRNRGKMAVRVG